MISFLKSLFLGPKAAPKGSMVVSFYLTSGCVVTTRGVKEVTTTKTPEGNFSSYSIFWHDGFKPKVFAFALDHISAIIAGNED